MGGGNASLKAAAPGAATISPLGSGPLEDPICALIQKRFTTKDSQSFIFTASAIFGLPCLKSTMVGARAPLNSFRIPFRTSLLIYDGVAATEERRDRGVGDGRVEGLLQV